MKVPFKWLKEYVDIPLSPIDLANQLTLAGNEVDGLQVISGEWDNIVVGQITDIKPHPNADRLTLPTIDLGTEQQTVVCGAPDLKIGDKVAFARVGAQLNDPHSGHKFRLKSTKIRGIASNGMACSEKELGISDNHKKIMVLPPDAPVGAHLGEYLYDAIFNMSITPNRPDCLSVIGIAREVAALTRQSLHLPTVSYQETLLPIDQQISVEIIAPELCPRYCASLITSVKVSESPQWMQQRLLACGLRPINNIVDVTNYVMLEYGQPLHAFDYQRIRDKKIIVRRAKDGEVIVSLDGTERVLNADMLVIADTQRAIAVAGVMGGANSEITPETTSVLLEAASFNPANIHNTGSILHMPSEACMRFERGISAELALPALKRATQLIRQLASGDVAKGWIDAFPGRKTAKAISLSTPEAERLLGAKFSLDQMVVTLTSLGFECVPEASKIRITAPYWRSDIHLTVDLIEEIIRIIGYDKIPTTLLSQSLPRQNPEPTIKLEKEVRRILTSYGFQELITYSLNSLDRLQKLFPAPHSLEPTPLRIFNPMTAEQEYLRPSLRPSLLAAIESNRRYEDDSIRFFEVGKVYLPRPGNLPDERKMVCGVLSKGKTENLWGNGHNPIDFYGSKGVVEGLLNHLHVDASFEDLLDKSLRSGCQAAIVVANSQVGVVGELHLKVQQGFGLSETIYLFEIDLTALLPFTDSHKLYQPIPRFPAVVRDMALVVDSPVTHRQICDIIRSSPLAAQVSVFDVYTGKQVPAGKKSLTYRIIFQSPIHTLTDEEVDSVQRQILDRLSRELGATLRS